MVLGIDVSRWSEIINWGGVANAGIKFAYIRATLGPEYRDPFFLYNAGEARRNGIFFGAYHYLTVDPGLSQAHNFIDYVRGSYEDALLPPAIDVEASGLVETTILDTLNSVESGLGIRPIIYTSATRWPISANWASSYGLWVAHYDVENPTLPIGWDEYDFHQYTDSGDGAELGLGSQDALLDRFNGTWDEFLWYIHRQLPTLRATPREKYSRQTWIVPSGIVWEDKKHLYQIAAKQGITITGSFDAPEWGTAVLFGIPESEHYKYVNFYSRYYPDVEVEFREL